MRSVYQSRLPPQLLAPDLFAMLSADGQIYGVCEACGWEHRVQLVGNYTAAKVGETIRRPCLSCGDTRGLGIAPHRLRVHGECLDCGSWSWLEVEHDLVRVPCPVCSSVRLVAREETVEPPFPVEFGEVETPLYMLRDDGPYVWGRSGSTDAQRLVAESHAAGLLPEAHRYIYLLIQLAVRLQTGDHYDDEGLYLITQVAANFCQGHLRAVGELEIGLLALNLFEQLIALAPDEPNRAIAQHSYAMGLYSLLARWPEDYLEQLTGRTGLRQATIELALEAEQTLAGYLAEAPEQVGAQLARVRFVIGDLLRVGTSDDDQRRSALTYFDAALTDPWVEQNLGRGVRESRAHTVMQLAHPSDELLQQAIADLQTILGTGSGDSERWRSAYYLGQLMVRYADDRIGTMHQLEQAAALAKQQFSAIADERQLLYQAEQFVHVFELLATCYADVSWNDEALSAVEITRGSAIRLYSRLADDREGWISGELDSSFEQDPIGPPVKALLRAHADVPTAFLSVFISDYGCTDPVATALLCYLSGPDEWQNKRHLWLVPDAELANLSAQRYFDPGPFRERLLRTASTSGSRALLEPLAELLEEAGVERVIVSLPGVLTRLPLEAFGVIADEQLATDRLRFTYLPSVRFGADLVGGVGAAERDLRAAGVLALGYDGDDIPAQSEELASLREIWGDQLTVIEGSDCTKESVLRALAEPFDIIHAVCHGSFDEASPLDSALHFTADRYNAARSVSARDLLMTTHFSTGPLVVLSACSSVVTADSRTNSFHGLAGSLFRCGARAIVGSRWPVDDRAAAALMARFHRKLRTTTQSPDLSLRTACAELREDGHRAEDWAAFGYYGVI
ncbi:CHAT domain-containing protein [Kribbella qitaiheensis]|uniref:CHAT domain-containing protein n=1 Tax=Kribbella qitaiheensis TaxID=1544730 RepID=A0A7G6X5U7_9ACTN|nr:CHAT domain-containing protein [Kribbella qitaiheensis]QNE21612.1 CHAT domain-containing protein [Kribbella qitaiheensis]